MTVNFDPPVIDTSREQRIEIATRLMERWLANCDLITEEKMIKAAKIFAKAALTIQEEA